MLPGAFFGALARLVALVQQLDFLELLESLGQQALGIFKLNAQFVGGAGQIFAPLDRGLGIGRIGEMEWISRSRSTDIRWKSAIMPSIWATLRRFSST